MKAVFKLGDDVVLQDNARVPDDGPLSVHFARLGIPYINVEAEMWHLPEQSLMLKTVAEMLAESESHFFSRSGNVSLRGP